MIKTNETLRFLGCNKTGIGLTALESSLDRLHDALESKIHLGIKKRAIMTSSWYATHIDRKLSDYVNVQRYFQNIFEIMEYNYTSPNWKFAIH